MKTYRGERIANNNRISNFIPRKRGNCFVSVDGVPLESPHADCGYGSVVFDWSKGYRGVLARNLSEAILLDFFGEEDAQLVTDEMVSLFLYNRVMNLPHDVWEIKSFEITDWLMDLVREDGDEE
jgi:hypothetical protein